MSNSTGLVSRNSNPIGRFPILEIAPVVDGGRWPAKAFAGEVLPFRARVFREGHDALAVELLLTRPDGEQEVHRMWQGAPGTDFWHTSVWIRETGDYVFQIRAFADDFETWHHNAQIKIAAEIDLDLMMLEGVRLFTRAAAEPERTKASAKQLAQLGEILADSSLTPHQRLEATEAPEIQKVLLNHPMRSLITLSESYRIRSERTRAGVGSWYEFFPRSEGATYNEKTGVWKSGTFKSAMKRLPAVAEMGFQVLYLPPIHPIGRAFRKGPNNSLNAGEQDPGSPWAIGAEAGGHDKIHPDLGTEKDFKAFVTAAQDLGIEIALDFALQASPDHPWVTEHPEWFTTRADGTIAYAENPPKKYQDIYPINFDNDREGIYLESLRIIRHWISLGVRIFRVDNPHTKPVNFWEWLLAEVNAEFPDVIFLAEAFTRPAMMHTLGKIGYQQSYTYFTWRNTKQELESYLTELAHESADFFRPNLWVNTPDILTEYLQFGGHPAFKIRAALAATAAPSWGMYAGFELFEAVARPGAEENIDNEKYQYRPRDWAGAAKAKRTLAPYISKLNEIRAQHPALRQLRNLELHWSDDQAILAFSKHLPAKFTETGKPDTILVIANVDPHAVRETTVRLDPTKFGVPHDARFDVTDLITGQQFQWSSHNYVKLDAFVEPVHIFKVGKVH